ncbi:tyrosine-type recombinase/integrase [Saccharothrix luteola]|uniref:tyrosine-type recombinase/integrase n=1 Tax=Saccharothrix luteola TaxID=2893018 RepID=UPI001E5ACA6F|nr:site-specific integrase [Saccharothrix luteola]MCC8250494.1 tyrosine-type recombinase/integrase [Saccharothrix luteola]
MSTDPTTVRAARLLISQLGLTPEDLMWVPTDLPTFRDYVPHVISASGTGSKRTYGTYWTRIIEAFGDKRLDEVTPSEIEGLMRRLVENRRIRRNDRGGHSVAEHLLAAMRAIYNRAINDNLLPPQHNPAGKVPKPRRRPTTRQSLGAAEVTALADAVTTSGHDTVLDTLLFRLHLETACRRGGALALREDDIEPTTCLIQLREKNDTVRWQPASPTLIASLLAHRQHRGNGKPSPEPLLRHRDGNPINHRRYDRLWERLGDRLPWVTARNVSTHWLRHTTLTWVERHYGPSVARGYAGHAHPRSDDVTAVYTKPTIADLATALAAYTGEPHPLSTTPPPAGGLPVFPILNPLQP